MLVVRDAARRSRLLQRRFLPQRKCVFVVAAVSGLLQFRYQLKGRPAKPMIGEGCSVHYPIDREGAMAVGGRTRERAGLRDF
jgi:hypothetical protein